LSPAILAQRAAQPGEDNQVVHVSIGRIDVVANVAPAPAAARTPKPRSGTVALADYLRGDNGSRR
jgi:acyl CoA:acetate/3-ketoacid CoA transferase beta subunit